MIIYSFIHLAGNPCRFFLRTSKVKFHSHFLFETGGFEVRPGLRFSELISIFGPMGLYMDQTRNKLVKACSRTNFEKRAGEIVQKTIGNQKLKHWRQLI